MSTIIASNVSDGTLSIPTTYVTNGSAKAWANFDGTGTIAARDSLNLSSLTDNGTGDYTVNFTSAFGAAEYSISGSARFNVGTSNEGSATIETQQAGLVEMLSVASGTLFDTTVFCTTAHGDLA
jgi:hypothetical protein